MCSDVVLHPLAYIRQRHGWSLADVARIVARGRNMAAWRQKIYRWERGVVPEPAAQEALAQELGINTSDIAAHGWPGWLLLAVDMEVVDLPWTTENAAEVLSRVETAETDRRGFLVIGGAALSGLASAWAQSTPAQARDGLSGKRIGHGALYALDARVKHLWELDDVLGGGSCLPLAAADFRLAVRLIRNSSYSLATGERLFALAASLGRTAGWAAFDAGFPAAAQRYWHAALRASHAGNDDAFGAYVLSNLALLSVYKGQPREAVTVFETAHARARRADDGCTLALIDVWRTRALAQVGEAQQAERTLDRADDEWARCKPEDRPPWFYWMTTPPSLSPEVGLAFAEMQQYAKAEQLLKRGLDAFGTGNPRDSGLYLMGLAEVWSKAGQVDASIAAVRQVAEAADGIESERLRARLDGLLATFPDKSPEIREVREQLGRRGDD